MEMKEAYVEEDVSIKKNNLLQSMKVEMVKVRHENEKLKASLSQIMNEYRSLEVHYQSIVQQKETINKNINFEASKVHDEEFQKHPKSKFTPLSLSIRDIDSSGTKHEKNTEPISKSKEISRCTKVHEDLVLRLDCMSNGTSNSVMSDQNTAHPIASSEDSFQEAKDKEKETWSPINKIPKFNGEDGDEETPQPTVKRARVSVRARCDAPTMNDGCQWRKYGQKIAKGNPCPRGYYRCTVVPGCPVRKQVQRCSEDKAILITTYEGTHNHPLPAAATTMASTTSAAASMLLSGSTSSMPPYTAPGLSNHHLLYTNHLSNHTMNVYPQHSLYTSPSHPTITLDLTKPTPSHPIPSMINPYINTNSTTFNHNLGSLGQSYLPSGSTSSASSFRPPDQSALTDTLANAIAANPNFQSVLAAAITSYVGGQAPTNNLSLDHELKWGEHLALGYKHSNDANIANVTGVSHDFATRSSSLIFDQSAINNESIKPST